MIGAGLAGSETAWQLAERGIEVDLYEMRPHKKTPAHQTDRFAELVCSNSLGSTALPSASAILKEELTQLNAMVLAAAYRHQVPAGASLAVDRENFSKEITEKLRAHPKIDIHEAVLETLPKDTVTVMATGPLTDENLAKDLAQTIGQRSLYFYDAISPIVSTESLDLSQMYYATRYGKGDPDFLNIPLNEAQYLNLVEDLLSGEKMVAHEFEEEKYFEACMPIETLAARGPKTLCFGPMKPVGLNLPSGERPYAVIQLRTENRHFTAYNLVGFQTKLKHSEQKRVFRKLPGMANAEFIRLGSIHRNTFVDSPHVLLPTLQLRARHNVFLAGQLTGTEGYLESTATGLLAALQVVAWINDRPLPPPPQETMLGALVGAITDPNKKDFQPLNSNFFILPPLEKQISNKQERRAALLIRARTHFSGWLTKNSQIIGV